MKQKPNLKQKIHPSLHELIVEDKTYKAFKKLAVEMIPTIETTSSMFDNIADDYEGVVDYDDNGNLKPIDYSSEDIDVRDYLKYNAKKSKKVVTLYKKLADMYDNMSNTQKFYVMERLKAENKAETDPKLKANIDNLVRLAGDLHALDEKYSEVGNDLWGHLDDVYETVSTLQNSEEDVRNNFTGEQLKLRGNQYLDVLTKKFNEIENDNTLTPVAKNTLKILYKKLARAEFSDSRSGYYDSATNTYERSYKYQSEQNSLSWHDDTFKIPLDNKHVQGLLGYDFFDTKYENKDFEKNVKKIIADRKKGIDTTKPEYTRQFNKVQTKQPSMQQTKLANPKGLPSLVNKVRDNRTQKELPQMKQKQQPTNTKPAVIDGLNPMQRVAYVEKVNKQYKTNFHIGQYEKAKAYTQQQAAKPKTTSGVPALIKGQDYTTTPLNKPNAKPQYADITEINTIPQKRAELKRINKQYGTKFTDAQYNDAVKYEQTQQQRQTQAQIDKQKAQETKSRLQSKRQVKTTSGVPALIKGQDYNVPKMEGKPQQQTTSTFENERNLPNAQRKQQAAQRKVNTASGDVIPMNAQTKSTRINNAKQRNVLPQNDNAIPLLSGKELAPTNDYTANWQNDAEQLRQDKLNQRANAMYFDENGNPILDSQPNTQTRQPQVIIDENGVPETRQSWQSRNADVLDAVNWSEQEMQRAYEQGVRENLDTAYYENWLRDNQSAAQQQTPPLSRSEQIRQQRLQRQAQVEQAQRQQTGNTLADLLRQRQQQVMANQQYENDFNQLLEQENRLGYDTSQIGQGDMAARPSTLAQVGSGVKKAFAPNAPSLVRTPQTLGDIAATNIVKGVGRLNLLDPTNLLVQGINKSGQALTNVGTRIGQAGANAGKAAQLGSKAAGAVPKLVGGTMSGIAKKVPLIAQGISIADALNQGDYAQSEIDNDLNAYLQANDPQGLQDYIQKVNTNNALNESDTWKSAALRGFVTAGNIVEGLSPLGIYQTATGVKDLYDALSGNGLVDSESMTGLSSLIANQLISDEDAMQFLPKEDKAKWNTLTDAQKDAALNRVRARAVYDKHYMQQAGTAQLGSQFGKSMAQDYQYNNPNMLDQDVFANVRGQLGIKDTSAIPKLQRNALPEINQVFNPAEVDLNPYTVEQVRQFASTQAFNPNLPKNVQDDYMKQAVSLNRQLAPQKTKQYKVDTANTYKSPTAGGVNPLYAQNLGGRNVEVTKPPALDKNALYGDIQTGGQYTQQLLQPYVPQLSKQYQKETLINNIQNQMKALKGGR